MTLILRIIILSGLLLLQACQHTHDEEEANNKLKKQPDMAKAASYNTQLGMGYLKQGNRSRAKKKLLLAIQQQPDSADVNAALAYYFEKSSEFDKAKSYYLKAIAYSNDGGAQLNNYGAFLCRQGDYKESEKYFLKAVNDQQYIHTAGAYENAALCAQAIPDNNKAIKYFNNALERDPSRIVSLYELIKLQASMGNYTGALTTLEKHPEIVLRDKTVLKLAVEIAQKANQPKIAAEYNTTLSSLKSYNEISGAENEYNTRNG